MNKKFLTVAVAAALVAPTAFAEVTIYGKLHMSMDYTDTDTTPPAGEDKTNFGVSSNSSRLGFKGDENLGGGMKAVWQIESAVDLDGDAGSALAGRNTYLGLAGGFGTFLMGRHDTPYKMLGRSLDPFGDTIADTRQLLGNTNVADGTGFDLRAPNVIAYITPPFSGFSAVLAYVTGVAPTSTGADNNKLDAFSLNATYKNGPIYAGLAYETHSKDIGGPAAVNSPSAWRLGGSYSFGPATVGGMWEQVKDDDYVDAKRSGGTIFGTYSFGMETVKLAYTVAGEWETGGNKVTNTDASLFAVGIDHQFSKRTTAYAQYSMLTNEKAAAYSLGGGNSGYGDKMTGVGLDRDPSAFSVGLIHKF